jgi:hypothetical protein
MSQNGLICTIQIKDRTGRVIGTKEVVTYPGLLSKAHEEGLQKIATKLLQVPSDENARTAIAKAWVETKKGRFEGIGDANPENVNSFIVPHLIRMAETRAKARALRDAVNIGIVSFEELDGDGFPPTDKDLGSGAVTAQQGPPEQTPPQPTRVTGNGQGPMTEAQRRYLFRLLAAQGLENDAAHDYLKDAFGVKTLKDVAKHQATQMIDGLLKHAAEVAGGTGQR